MIFTFQTSLPQSKNVSTKTGSGATRLLRTAPRTRRPRTHHGHIASPGNIPYCACSWEGGGGSQGPVSWPMSVRRRGVMRQSGPTDGPIEHVCDQWGEVTRSGGCRSGLGGGRGGGGADVRHAVRENVET